MSRIIYLTLLAISMAVLVSAAPERRDLEERQLDSVLNDITSGAGSVFGQATSGAGSVFSQVTNGAGSVLSDATAVVTTVVSAAQGAATVVKNAGGQAITLAESGASQVTSFGGEKFTPVVTSFAGHTYTALVRQNSARASFDGLPMAAAFFTTIFGAVVGALLTV